MRGEGCEARRVASRTTSDEATRAAAIMGNKQKGANILVPTPCVHPQPSPLSLQDAWLCV